MSIIRTRSGTLEFRQTPNGPMVVLNGQHPFSVGDFLRELLDVYYELDLQHPGGSAAWLQLLTGIDLHSRCPLCDQPTSEGEITKCPVCTIGRCPRCAHTHDGEPLCLLTREYAEVHREMRGDDDFDQSDWYFARRSIASTYLTRGRH